MLGSDLMDVGRTAGIEMLGFDLPEVDIANYEQLSKKLPKTDWIANCAAYTKVDDAEEERDAAFAVNAEGARNLGRLSLVRDTRVLHVSTDYVFDGRAGRPYDEQDRPNPLNVYGASKLSGEKELRSEGGKFLVVRSQSLFGKNGTNFIKAIVRKVKESEAPLRVVDDQISAPTYTRHLAEALLRLMQIKHDGLVHVTASGSCTWYEFAQRIVAEIKPGHEVLPIKTSDMKRPALRPMYSILSNQRYQSLTGHVMPTWKEGLEAYFYEEDYFT